MESQFDIWRYVAILRRRWLYLVLPAIVVAVASVGFAYTTPPVYESSATILVESQQIPTDLASPTVTSDAAERIRVIEQRLLTRDNLLQIAGKYNLFQFLGPNLSPTTLVENVRKAVQISQIDSIGSGSGQVVGFTVKFQYRDATTVARVTNDLVTSILSQNVESRLNRASETSAFFAQQKTSLEQRLLELETKMASFKRANEADLPETLEVRREQLAQIRLQIADLDQKLRLASAPDGVGADLAGPTGVKQLNFSLQGKELDLKSFTEQRDELLPLEKKGFVPTNRIRDLERQIAQTKLDIESIKAQITDRGGALSEDGTVKYLGEQRTELEGQATKLSESIQRTPLVQVQLNSMDRDYENLQSEYRLAQTKLENAQVGERLEQDRQSERFEVIEQATVPDTPSSPDRPKIMMAGVASGLAAGAGFVVLRQLLTRSIYSAAEIERALQIRPIAVVPYIATTRERRGARVRLLVLLIAIVIAMLIGLYAIDTYYMPLNLVVERIWERLHTLLASTGIVR